MFFLDACRLERVKIRFALLIRIQVEIRLARNKTEIKTNNGDKSSIKINCSAYLSASTIFIQRSLLVTLLPHNETSIVHISLNKRAPINYKLHKQRDENPKTLISMYDVINRPSSKKSLKGNADGVKLNVKCTFPTTSLPFSIVFVN